MGFAQENAEQPQERGLATGNSRHAGQPLFLATRSVTLPAAAGRSPVMG